MGGGGGGGGGGGAGIGLERARREVKGTYGAKVISTLNSISGEVHKIFASNNLQTCCYL